MLGPAQARRRVTALPPVMLTAGPCPDEAVSHCSVTIAWPRDSAASRHGSAGALPCFVRCRHGGRHRRYRCAPLADLVHTGALRVTADRRTTHEARPMEFWGSTSFPVQCDILLRYDDTFGCLVPEARDGPDLDLLALDWATLLDPAQDEALRVLPSAPSLGTLPTISSWQRNGERRGGEGETARAAGPHPGRESKHVASGRSPEVRLGGESGMGARGPGSSASKRFTPFVTAPHVGPRPAAGAWGLLGRCAMASPPTDAPSWTGSASPRSRSAGS